MLYLNVEHLQRSRQTLDSSLKFYHQAASGSVDQEVFRNAIVKSYELTQETAFKLLKKALKQFGYGSQTLDTMLVKDVLRMAAQHGLMTLEEVQRWFTYRDNRNHTAHDYGEGFAAHTLQLIPDFLADIEQLTSILVQKFGKDANA